MKIGIYSELFQGAALGGREYIVAVLCEAFRRDGHSAEYVHHIDDLTVEEFSGRFGISADSIRLRHVQTRPPATLRNFFASQQARRQWDRSLSDRYDLFINIVHGPPAPSFAKHGLLIVLFPFFEPFNVFYGRAIAGKSLAWVLARYGYHRLKWRRWLDSYGLKTAISDYSRRWTLSRWGVDSTVIYPPGDTSFAPGTKANRILSVGRFSGFRVAGLSKRQLEQMGAFVALRSRALDGWEYHSIGGLGGWAQDQAYYAEVEQAAAATNGQAHVCANAPREHLKHLYESSKIFWHAAGYGDDDSKHPELMEHFGIATVDAMAAGCVPVVINKGAQPEIVEHGVSGFLWETLEELSDYTSQLANDDALRAKMAEAAQLRAKEFSREAFERRFRDFVQPALSDAQ